MFILTKQTEDLSNVKTQFHSPVCCQEQLFQISALPGQINEALIF